MQNGAKQESVIDLALQVVDLIRRYIEQEARAVIERSLVEPARRVGIWLSLTIIGATLFALAAIFLSVGLFQLLATLVGAAWIAYLIVGGALFIGGAILVFLGRKLGAQ